jgi:hypothetical protein
MFRQLMPF